MRNLIFACAVGMIMVATGTLPGRAGAGLDRSTDGQDVTVTLTSPFSDIPPGGCLPYQVKIRNDRSAAGTWHLLFQGDAYGSGLGTTLFEKDLSVAPNATASFDLVVPMPISNRAGNISVNVGVTGPGFGNSHNQYFAYLYSNDAGSRSPFALIGTDIVGSIGSGPLESAYKDQASTFYGSIVDTASLPTDWRAYSGVATLLLRDSEWLILNAAQREAVCDYVAQGGRLTLFTSENLDLRTPELQLPSPGGKPGDFGFGNISLVSTPSFPPDTSLLLTAIENNPASPAELVDQHFSTWGLRPLVGTIVVSAGFILCFVLFFGSLVGPINLFVFAGGNNRFRLFWTTPLISIMASLGLIGCILLTDGLGGSGKQMIAIFSLPDVNREVVVQEQVARTAVLFSNQWHNDQNYLITPISNAAMQNALGADGGRSYGAVTNPGDTPAIYHQDGDDYSGNWFRSRSVSGQYLQAVRPSRFALTVMNPPLNGNLQDAPVVLSSFPDELDKVFLRDWQGRYWKCAHLEPGRKASCVSCPPYDFDKFWNDACVNAGGKLRPLLTEAARRNGCFYATGIPSPDERLATLGEVRWEVVQGIYLGQWVASTTPENAP
jgi:hypothetical protein